MKDCVFCKIIKGEVPTVFEWEDDEMLAFEDIKPIAPVHILIIPKKHITSLGEAGKDDVELLGKIQKTAAEIAKKKGIGSAFKVLTASGKGAGQTVFHMHYHLIGGWKNGVPEMESEQEEAKE